MARKKCPECGYKFKGVDMDSNICPKCFAHVNDNKNSSSIQPIKILENINKKSAPSSEIKKPTTVNKIKKSAPSQPTSSVKANTYASCQKKSNSTFSYDYTRNKDTSEKKPVHLPYGAYSNDRYDGNRPDLTNMILDDDEYDDYIHDAYDPLEDNWWYRRFSLKTAYSKATMYKLLLLIIPIIVFVFIYGALNSNPKSKDKDATYDFNLDGYANYTFNNDNTTYTSNTVPESEPFYFPATQLAPNGYLLSTTIGKFGVVVENARTNSFKKTSFSDIKDKYNVEVPSSYYNSNCILSVYDVDYIIWNEDLSDTFTFNAELIPLHRGRLSGFVLDQKSEENYMGFSNATKLTVTYLIPYDKSYTIRIPSLNGDSSVPDYSDSLNFNS